MWLTILLVLNSLTFAKADHPSDFKVWVKNSVLSGEFVINDQNRPAPRSPASQNIKIDFEVVQSDLNPVKVVQIKNVEGVDASEFESVVEPLIEGALQGSKFSDEGFYSLTALQAEDANTFSATIDDHNKTPVAGQITVFN